VAHGEDGLGWQRDERDEDGLGAAGRRTYQRVCVDMTLSLSSTTGGVSINNKWWTYYKEKNNSYKKHNLIVSPVVRASDNHEVTSSAPVSLSLVFCFKEK
jgi:hypothetical protein